MTIGKGEFVFLTGPSGAGKSTLLRLLLLQDRPTSGDAVVAGRNLARLKRNEVQAYRRTVGFVFQDFKLIQSKQSSRTSRLRWRRWASRWSTNGAGPIKCSSGSASSIG